MAHSHSHDHSKAFGWSIGLNLLIVLVEIGGGIYTGSLALIADSAHNLGDVLGLVMAWGATRLSKRESSPRYTYGLRRSSTLAALANALILLMGTGGLLWEAIDRLVHGSSAPSQPAAIMAVAFFAMLINGITGMMFSGHGGDANLRAAFLHLLSDALVNVAVVISGAVIWYTGWAAVDPVVTILVGVSILWSTWGLFRESLALSLDAVPAHIDPAEVEAFLAGQEGVESLHELHIWPLSTNQTALSVHIVRPQGLDDSFLRTLCASLNDQFRICHATIQLEQGTLHCTCHPVEEPPPCHGHSHSHGHSH